MSAFLDGFFSVFRAPFCPPGEIPTMDWGVDLSNENWRVIKPAGEIKPPPNLRTTWEKVGKYLQYAMTEYERSTEHGHNIEHEHNIEQQGNNGTVEHDGAAHPADVP